nr:trypsin-like [Onthophagus taurus]
MAITNLIITIILLISVCYVSTTDDRIVGGRPALIGEIPYQVSIRRSYNDRHFCGGVLITSKHILTAAHCMYYIWGGLLPPLVISAVFGQLNLPIEEKSVYRNASKIVIYPSFIRKTMSDDLAIIEVNEELPIGKNPLINTVSLRNEKLERGKCFVSGWGVEEYNTTTISKDLLLAEVNLIDFDVCQKKYGNISLYDGMLCAGHVNGTTDACQGDSGGPLICEGLLTGIVSTGSGCGSADFPGIYTEVSKYYDWIINVTTSNYKPTSLSQNQQSFDGNNEFLTNKDFYSNKSYAAT